MKVFDDFLPWTKKRIEGISQDQWQVLFNNANGIIQDQQIPITNIMVLLGAKLLGNQNLNLFKNRHALVQWYQSVGRYTFDIDGLQRLRSITDDAIPAGKVNGVNLIGYSGATTGLGEDVRNLAAMLESIDIPYAINMLGHPADSVAYIKKQDRLVEHRYSHSIFCINLIEYQKIWQSTPDLHKVYGKIALQAPWELPNLPKVSKECLDSVDTFWCISSFVLNAFESQEYTNSVLVPPICIANTEITSFNQLQSRPFTFLYVFDASSYLQRKNPLAAVNAFQTAFPTQTDVRLVLKVANVKDSSDYQALQRACLSDKRIKLDSQMYSTDQLTQLMQRCDCYLSLHRSEGFGRTIAEACILGKPVIATNWSGSVDILGEQNVLSVSYRLVPVEEGQYPYSEGQAWAEAEIDDAADKMRQIVSLPEKQRAQIGDLNRIRVLERYTLTETKSQYRDLLAEFLVGQ
ncbi:glycosyltransferase [Aliiglaciecola litoralis]|uniref:Glycosyl transferase family 1 domain-containing protein n=1 Tax=Aliiglaciecola litoralis TaxID=582857 RepID=A0ABP3WUE3_9ALTE